MVPVFALLLGGLIIGSEQLQSSMHLPASIAQVLEGALLLGFLASEAILRYRIRPNWRRELPVSASSLR